MSIISNLFGESPFGALEAHGEKVKACLDLLKEAFHILPTATPEDLGAVAEKIFALETEADKIRNHVHEMLSSKVLLPLKKEDLYNILEQQDSMADRAEEIAAVLTYRDLRLPEPIMAEVNDYLARVFQNCELEAGIMSKFDLLVESSFSGLDAITVSKLITELSEKEDALKAVEIKLTRTFLRSDHRLDPVGTVLWLQILGHLADLAKCADRVGNGIRLTLKIKETK